MALEYAIVDGFDHIIDEKPGTNVFLALRKIQWKQNGPVKLDLRKWATNSDGTEVPLKGVSFIDETEGPNNLIQTLITTGYGNTKDTLLSLKDREDFRPSLNSVLGKDDELYDSSIKEEEQEIFYDPKESLF